MLAGLALLLALVFAVLKKPNWIICINCSVNL